MAGERTERPKRMEPPTTELTEPFWEATRERRLLLQWCSVCDRVIQYPRDACPFCTSGALEWREASGLGSIYTFTIEHKMPSPIVGADGPYTVALVDLAEGARLMTNIVNCAVEALVVGMAVRVSWEELSDGRQLPLFEPAT